MKITHLLLSGMALLFSACASNTPAADTINTEASLPASLNFNQLGLKVITSSINTKKQTMSTLYGNDLARKNAIEGHKSRPSGEVLALITWKQKEDKHWFGANIPAGLQSLEMIKTEAVIGSVSSKISYQRFEGSNLTLSQDTLHNQESIKYIFDLKPSVMP